MDLTKAKDLLYDVVSMFFVGAEVIWAEQAATKPKPPYVTLKTGAVQRTAFPVVNDYDNRYFQCRTTAEINLYTNGLPLRVGKKVNVSYVNTAVSDMTAFFNFVESEAITDLFAGYGMEVTLSPPVRDLTDLQNDGSYRYRSMAEATVTYCMEADGYYGIIGIQPIPSSSGGGTAEMASAEIDAIQEIEITDVKEGGNDSDEE